ncbi:MAG: peptidoglycan-binding domain-containing protein [Bacteroidota bacterium]
MTPTNFTNTPTLLLGNYDTGKLPNKENYLKKAHSTFSNDLRKKHQFKDERFEVWRDFVEVEGQHVQNLQTFLYEAGFMPHFTPDGIFGYETLAGVRLFQEYMRTIKSKGGKPDGIPGHGTFSMITEWQNQNYGVCEWADATPSDEYNQWIDLLNKRKSHFENNPNAILSSSESYDPVSDTRKITDWDTSTSTIHLIGVRRNQAKDYAASDRDNDFFTLLINGKVFHFFGSTVPNPKHVNAYVIGSDPKIKNYPFLLEGQHCYRLGWHQRSKMDKTYKAWRPAGHGVIVYRQAANFSGSKVIEDTQILKNGLDHQPNATINLHWSGRGTSSFSGGCQVIGGASYINNRGELINDSTFAALNASDLSKTSHHTKAAYDMLIDLFTSYSPSSFGTIAYSLLREEELYELEDWPRGHIAELEKKMKTVFNPS